MFYCYVFRARWNERKGKEDRELACSEEIKDKVKKSSYKEVKELATILDRCVYKNLLVINNAFEFW